ncbi:MAG: hypothetical protein KC501_01945 [Myxococcales bacterium]|nr:hypothetical protein [Myxococcales bacterium]
MINSSSPPRPKIVFCRGSRAEQLAWAQRSAAAELFELDCTRSAFVAPWRATRGLLRELVRRRGLPAVEDALAPHQTHLSTVLRPLRARLSPEQAKRREEESGALLGRLPAANSLTVGTIAEAFAATFSTLLGRGPTVLVLSSVADLDSESWGLLSPLLRRHPSTTLLVGHAREEAPPLSVIHERVATIGGWEASMLASLRHVDRHSLPLDGEAPPEPPLFDPGTAHPLDDELEQRASDRLDDQAPLDSAARELVVQAIEQSFDALGFPAVVSLAQRLLARDDEWDGIAQVRLLAGLAAHNLCAFAKRAGADHPLYAFGDRMLDLAFPSLPAPEDRVLVLYRRGMRLASHPQGLAPAQHLLATAVEAARSLDPRHVLHRVYAHNASAFVEYRQGRRDAAREHCEAALRVAQASHPDAPAADVGAAHFNVLVNLSRLAFLDGDIETSRRRLLEAKDHLHRLERRRPFFSWFSTQVFLDDMAAARDDIERTLAEIEPLWMETTLASYSYWAADLHFRLGDASRALARYRLAAELWACFHEDPGDVFLVHLNCAIAAFRAERLDEARARFGEALRQAPDDDFDLRAELHAALALVAAKASDRAAARRWIDEATLALESVDEPEVWARTHRVLGDAQAALGDQDGARRAFRRGLEPFGTKGELPRPDELELPPEDALGLLLGLLELGEGTAELVGMAVTLGRPALQDPSAWWDAPRLVALLRQPRWRDVVVARWPEVDALLDLVRQRPDCTAPVDGLRAEARG